MANLPGAISFQILAVLNFDFDHPVTGSEIWKQCENRVERRVSSGTMYMALAKLVKREWAIESVTTSGRPARAYEISAAGRELLKQYIASISQKASGEAAVAAKS